MAKLGLDDGKVSLPPPTYDWDADRASAAGHGKWGQRVVRHITAVVRGRVADEAGVQRVATALAAADPDLPAALLQTPEFAAHAHERAAVRDALAVLQEHWSALLAVHVWDRCALSRREMETLRHLLSFTYDAEADTYSPLVVWSNGIDLETAPTLASRQKREKCAAKVVAKAGITVDAQGHCQRDFRAVTETMYSNFSAAMRDDYTPARPARPVYYIDATGAALGRGLTHSEVGSADFVGERQECKQSRATLGPLHAHAGSDKPIPIRECAEKARPPPHLHPPPATPPPRHPARYAHDPWSR